jgi:hypothetical protein
MSLSGHPSGYEALGALLAAQSSFPAVADKDWAAAAGLIVKKLLVSAGQTTDSLKALRAAAGEEIFDSQLKTLSHHHAKLLAKRLDKSVPDLEVSTARAAIAHIRALLTGTTTPAPATEETVVTTETESEGAPEPTSDETPPSPPSAPNPYFGRKSFRTG